MSRTNHARNPGALWRRYARLAYREMRETKYLKQEKAMKKEMLCALTGGNNEVQPAGTYHDAPVFTFPTCALTGYTPYMQGRAYDDNKSLTERHYAQAWRPIAWVDGEYLAKPEGLHIERRKTREYDAGVRG